MHIMSDEQYNRLMAMKAYMEDPAPLPMWDEEDEDLRAVYPEGFEEKGEDVVITNDEESEEANDEN